MKKRSVAFT